MIINVNIKIIKETSFISTIGLRLYMVIMRLTLMYEYEVESITVQIEKRLPIHPE